MQRLYVATAAMVATTLPTVSVAQELGISAGVTLTSEYVSQGFELSDGPALQPYVELSFGGLYGGVWASNGSQDLLGANSEVDYYLGYRGEVGRFYYDIGYAYYTFQDPTFAFDYGEYLFSAGYAVTDAVYATLAYGYAPDYFEQGDASFTIEYFTNYPGLALAASFGDVTTDFGDWNYWSVGGSYAINDNVSLDLTYYDGDSDLELGLSEGLIVGSVSFDFSLR